MGIHAFHTPASVEEAVRLMHEGEGRGAYVAGGTDLVCWKDKPDFVVNVRDLIRETKRDNDAFHIGGAATLTQIEQGEELAGSDDGLLRRCAREFGSWHVRNMATAGGNLASAYPSADAAPPLLVLEAECAMQGKDGERTVPLDQFFKGPRQSVLGQDLLTAIRFPVPEAGARGEFLKICRNPGAIASINVAALLWLDGAEITKARIALGAVAPTPLRAYEAEDYLTGKPASDEHLDKAAELAQAATKPISDQRASADYRRHMSYSLTKRALQRCARRSA